MKSKTIKVYLPTKKKPQKAEQESETYLQQIDQPNTYHTFHNTTDPSCLPKDFQLCASPRIYLEQFWFATGLWSFQSDQN